MNTEYHSEVKREGEEWQLHRMAKIHHFVEMWQASKNLRAAHKKSQAQYKQMTTAGYISDTEEIVKASCPLFQDDGVAAFELSVRSPLPPALSTQDLPAGQTQVLYVCQIKRIDHHPVESDEDSAPDSIWDRQNWLNWNSVLDNPNDSNDDCEKDIESDIELEMAWKIRKAQGCGMWVPHQMIIQPTRKSKNQAQIKFVTINAIHIKMNTEIKKT